MTERDNARSSPPGDTAPPDPDTAGLGEIEGVFRVWIDTDLKVQLLVFFHDNPGVMETTEGLARRLGLNEEVLADNIRDHVQLGILSERDLGSKKIYVYNRGAERSLGDRLREAVEQRMKGGAA